MDDHIRKLKIKIHNKETELNKPFTKIKKLEDEIATLKHKKLISKKLETAEMSLSRVLEVILKRKRKIKSKWLEDILIYTIYNGIYIGKEICQ